MGQEEVLWSILKHDEIIKHIKILASNRAMFNKSSDNVQEGDFVKWDPN